MLAKGSLICRSLLLLSLVGCVPSPIYRTGGGKLWSVAVQTSPRFTAGQPTLVFEDDYGSSLTWSLRNYDIAPDGQRFLMIQPERQAGLREIVVVLNWSRELNRVVPAH